MRYAAIVTLILFSAIPVIAFDPEAEPESPRVAILHTDAGDDFETLRVAAMMRGYLARELRGEGFDAFESRATYEELLEGKEAAAADYYVEFVRAHAGDDGYGGVAVAGRHGGVELGLVVSRVAAAMRIYEGQSLGLIHEFNVQANDRAVMPTAIGIGGRHVGVWVGMPFLRAIRHRGIARDAARDAAQSIATVLASEDRSR